MKRILAVVVTAFDFALYLAMRSIWSGIEGMFGIHWLQYVVFGLLSALFLASCLLAAFRPKAKKAFLGLLIAGAVLALPLFYMLNLGIGSSRYILRSFGRILVWYAVIALIVFFLFTYPKSPLAKRRWFRFSVFGLALAAILVVNFNLTLCTLVSGPVVYAVEDEYQIVWITSANATGEVKVGEETFGDLYAGSLDSETTVHKVIVPMDVLDAAGEYTILSTQILYRGPYSGLRGRTLSETVAFHPIDLSDGLNYYTLSDSHEYLRAAAEAASWFGENLDFLILAGDIASHLEEEADIALLLDLAHRITGGSRPVVYARGNHETKGDVANQLSKYVGSKDEKFYYYVSLGRVFLLVLDLGEDHDDDWWEYYDTARFAAYRAEQTAFLEDLLLDPLAWDPSYVYRLGVCHMPVNYVTKGTGAFRLDNLFLKDVKETWTGLLNDLDLDLMVSGHHHQLMPITTDIPADTPLAYAEAYWAGRSETFLGIRTDSEFDTYVASRRSLTQNPATEESLFGKAFTGLATSVSFSFLGKPQITLRYTNSALETVSIVNPFLGTAADVIDKEGRTIALLPLA